MLNGPSWNYNLKQWYFWKWFEGKAWFCKYFLKHSQNKKGLYASVPFPDKTSCGTVSPYNYNINLTPERNTVNRVRFSQLSTKAMLRIDFRINKNSWQIQILPNICNMACLVLPILHTDLRTCTLLPRDRPQQW